MQDWARLLTPFGYVCFVIDYRLVPELPVPATDLDAENIRDMEKAITSAGIARANYARSKEGLPPLRDDEKILIWNGIFSAAEDLDKAVRHVRDNALFSSGAVATD